MFWFLSLIFVVFKINFEPTFLQSIFLFTFCSVKYLLIRRVFRQSLLDGIRNLLYDVWGGGGGGGGGWWFNKL